MSWLKHINIWLSSNMKQFVFLTFNLSVSPNQANHGLKTPKKLKDVFDYTKNLQMLVYTYGINTLTVIYDEFNEHGIKRKSRVFL